MDVYTMSPSSPIGLSKNMQFSTIFVYFRARPKHDICCIYDYRSWEVEWNIAKIEPKHKFVFNSTHYYDGVLPMSSTFCTITLWVNTLYYHSLWVNMLYYHSLWVNTLYYHSLWVNMLYYHSVWVNTLYYHSLTKQHGKKLHVPKHSGSFHFMHF